MGELIALGLLGWFCVELGLEGAVIGVLLMCLAGAGKVIKA